MTRKVINFKIILIAITLLFIMFFIIGCKYKEFTLREFTEASHFEYPSSYTIQEVDRTTNSGAIVVGLKFSENETLVATLAVSILKPNEQLPDISSLLEYNLSIAKKNQLSGEFKLIDKFQISIAGVQGEEIIYSRIRNPSTSNIEETERIPEIAYEAFFENNGYLWEIGVHSVIKMAEQAKADFKHILQTFKFVD